jgi:hypothetical protein
VFASVGFVVDGRAGRHFWTVLAVGVGVCAIMGWVVQNNLVRLGYRLTKPRPPDQAEDYEDRP